MRVIPILWLLTGLAHAATPLPEPPYVITQPGDYYLNASVNFSSLSGRAYQINAANVAIDGRERLVINGSGSGNTATGFEAMAGATNFTLRNITVAGFHCMAKSAAAYTTYENVKGWSWYLGLQLLRYGSLAVDCKITGVGAYALQGLDAQVYNRPQGYTLAGNGTKALRCHVVDIIIPVYRDQALVRACIASVLASLAHNRARAELVVIDDASPEPALSSWLAAQAAAGRFTLLRNHCNLGYIDTVNRALRLRPAHDALLLNADTLVQGDWIDRLAAALYSAPDIASVTPW